MPLNASRYSPASTVMAQVPGEIAAGETAANLVVAAGGATVGGSVQLTGLAILAILALVLLWPRIVGEFT